MTDRNWNLLLREQIDRHWTHRLRDRLDGLTDDEYFWEPDAERPMAAPVPHINRELIHRLSEVCLLRDLYPHTHRQTRQEAS